MVDAHRYCLHCWYVLDGLTSSRCPECGHTFYAGNVQSFATQPRLAHHLNRMLPVAGIAMLFLMLEIICISLVWNTMGEVMSVLWGMIVIVGNVIIFASMLLRRRWLPASLLVALVLLTCPYPIWLQIKLEFLEIEARQIIAYAEGVRLQTGSYPANLSGYQFRRAWTSSSFSYNHAGFRLHWWAHQPGVSHWYTPSGGFDYYPD